MGHTALFILSCSVHLHSQTRSARVLFCSNNAVTKRRSCNCPNRQAPLILSHIRVLGDAIRFDAVCPDAATLANPTTGHPAKFGWDRRRRSLFCGNNCTPSPRLALRVPGTFCGPCTDFGCNRLLFPVMALPPIASVIRIEVSTSSLLGACVTSRRVVSSTRWLQLLSLTYIPPYSPARQSSAPSASRTWDAAERTTRTDGVAADAVAVLARLNVHRSDNGNDPRILLVKQFRPPVNAICVELPAGLIDPGETPADAAIRELKEETGFTGNVVHVGAPEPLSPGATGETICIVHVDITSAQDAANALDESESIQVISVPMIRLREALDYLERVENCVVMHSVSTLATGIQLGAMWHHHT